MSSEALTTHPALLITQKILFDTYGLKLSDFHEDSDSKEYAACSFKLNEQHIVFRVSKITPKKIGQFVTVWKRNKQDVTQPFTKSDTIDYLIVFAQNEKNKGFFVFPKSVLLSKNIIADSKEGKRGMRVYPPWDKAVNKQAEKTQQWQVDYFLTIKNDQLADLGLAKKLLNL